MTNELKHCPFCGGEEVHIFNTGLDIPQPWRLNHPCRTFSACITAPFATAEEAIEAWNTRTQAQEIVLDVASLPSKFSLSDTLSLQRETYTRERTCRNKSRFAPGGTRFVCSACDFGSDWDMWDDNYGVPMDFWFDYCPNCGAKVVEE